jgi:tRNA threonylcarbamoyladenosine modification (KEOPS) complex  Pcc1 subunit
MSGARQGHGSRLEVLERSLGELTVRVEAVDLVDLRRSVNRLRELLLTIAEQIDEELTRA